MTRALLVHPGPEFSVADVHNGWVKGLTQLGVQVQEFNLNERLNFYSNAYLRTDAGDYVKAFEGGASVEVAAQHLRSACYDWWPDVVIITSGFYIPEFVLEVIRARNHKLVALFTESPYEDDRQLSQAAAYDLVLLNDPTNVEKFTAVTDALYVPHAYDPQVHYCDGSPRDLDAVFVGTGFPSRAEYLKQVDWAGIDLTLAGNWQATGPELEQFVGHDLSECLLNADTADLYRRAVTSFNLYRTESNRPELSDGWAMGPREVELASCGVWFARQSRPESDLLFPMLPTFDSPSELGEMIRWALANPEKRKAATDDAREAVADRTFMANAALLMQRLGI